MAAYTGTFLHQPYLEPGCCQIQRGLNAAYSAAYYHYVAVVVVHFFLLMYIF